MIPQSDSTEPRTTGVELGAVGAETFELIV